MRAYVLLILFLISYLLTANAADNDKGFSNPILEQGADPWIIKHDGMYYYCCVMSGNRIGISKSEYLHVINKPESVWQAPPTGKWNSANVWAPELHFYNGKWYIYYAAGFDGPPYIHQKTGVLESVTNDPFGEYTDKGMVFTGDIENGINKNFWSIDMTLLELNGKLYAVWSGWEEESDNDKTQQHIYIAEMKSPTEISTSRVKISSPDRYFEQGSLPLNEGPQILKHNNNIFIVYSCGQSWLKTYKLAYLKLKSNTSDPLIASNWMKSEHPVFQSSEDVFGVGHACFVKSPDEKEDYILYHAKKDINPGWQRDVRLQKFLFTETGLPCFGSPISTGIKMTLPSGSN